MLVEDTPRVVYIQRLFAPRFDTSSHSVPPTLNAQTILTCLEGPRFL